MLRPFQMGMWEGSVVPVHLCVCVHMCLCLQCLRRARTDSFRRLEEKLQKHLTHLWIMHFSFRMYRTTRTFLLLVFRFVFIDPAIAFFSSLGWCTMLMMFSICSFSLDVFSFVPSYFSWKSTRFLIVDMIFPFPYGSWEVDSWALGTFYQHAFCCT